MSLFNSLKAIFYQDNPERHEGEVDPMVLRAIVLLETALHDDEFALEERDAIKQLLADRYGLGENKVEDLLEFASSKLEKAADVYLFTRTLGRDMPNEERKELMTEIWQIIFADGRVDKHEEHFARKMQKMLRLDHPTWVEARQDARKRIEP